MINQSLYTRLNEDFHLVDQTATIQQKWQKKTNHTSGDSIYYCSTTQHCNAELGALKWRNQTVSFKARFFFKRSRTDHSSCF